MENREYYYCTACDSYVYRIPGHTHGDGQHDSDENPVYLLDYPEYMTDDEIEQADSRHVNCGCTD